MKVGWEVQPVFSIHLHYKDIVLLHRIKDYFGVGGVCVHKKSESAIFSVQSVKDCKVIIEHFDKYPLLTQKLADFELFKQAVGILVNKEHLTIEGLHKVVSIRASMNLGLTEVLTETFPNTIPESRPTVETPEFIDPNWLVGFTDGDGCFLIHVQNSPKSKSGKQVKIKFQVSQHERDIALFKSIILNLKCGTIQTFGNYLHLSVTRFEDIINIIIPLFKKYRLQGSKRRDF